MRWQFSQRRSSATVTVFTLARRHPSASVTARLLKESLPGVEDKLNVGARTRAALWVVSAACTLVGGFIAAILVSAGLCEDDGSFGSDGYCNGGGMEAALIAILIDVAAAIALPALALLSGREKAFKAALVVPLLGLALILVATHVFGTDA